MSVPFHFLVALTCSANPSAAVDAGTTESSMQPVPWPLDSKPVETPSGDAGFRSIPPAPAEDRRVKLVAAGESSLTSFPSGTPGGGQDALVDLRPIVGIQIGEDFEVEAGAEFRLRLLDQPPLQRAEDIGGILRRSDWDEASDFGQILRALRVNQPGRAFWLQAGSVRNKTLGLGHLISRYSNQDNPDYHPAGATIGASYQAFYAELFASDLLGARIFAGELVADLGRIFGSSEGLYDRFHLAFSLAHDAGRAGYLAPSLTLFQLDFDAVVYRGSKVRIIVLGGLGFRAPDLTDPTPDLGAVAGFAVDATLEGGWSAGLKLEFRKQQGGFRPGLLGPGYEVARFAGTGFRELSRAAELLPDSFSGYGEVRISAGRVASFDLAVEHFEWGRTDIDSQFSLEIINSRLVASARFTGLGLGKVPRYAVTSQLRLRIFASFYLLASGGTVFFPQPDGTLVRGVSVGGGVGIDFER